MSLIFWILGALLIGGVLVVTIAGIISKEKIKEHLNQEGLIGKIKEIQPNSITLETLNRLGESQMVEYQSEDGVSSDLYVGQII